MRASKILATRPERAVVALAQLCEERKDEELLHASPSRSHFAPTRLSPVPKAAQTPYTIGSNPLRPTGAPEPDRLSPPEVHEVPSVAVIPSTPTQIPSDHPEHMGPKRSKWTSPPPPEAPEADRSAFEDRLGQSLAFATSSMEARERDRDGASSSANSDIVTDEDELQSIPDSDEVRSVRSFTDDTSGHRTAGLSPVHPQQHWTRSYTNDPSSSCLSSRLQTVQTEGAANDSRWIPQTRGRPAAKMSHSHANPDNYSQPRLRQESFIPPPRMEPMRRSASGPAGPQRPFNRYSMSALPTIVTPVSVYPTRAPMMPQSPQHRSNNVFYETIPFRERMARALGVDNTTPVPRLPAQGRLEGVARVAVDNPLLQHRNATPRHLQSQIDIDSAATPPLSTTPSQATVSLPYARLSSHSHSHSQSTIIAPTPPPPDDLGLPSPSDPRKPSRSQSHSRSRSRSPGPTHRQPEQPFRCVSPSASTSSTSGSPPMSCSSSQYAPSISPLSTSPPSPAHSEAFTPPVVELDIPVPETLDVSPVPPIGRKDQIPPADKQPRIAILDASEDEAPVTSAEALAITP